MADALEDRRIGACTVLFGAGGGRYPDANALLVEGPERTILIDAPLGVYQRAPQLPTLDAIVLTHAHEDHVPGLARFPETPCWVHSQDAKGLQSIDDFLELFGMGEPRRSEWRRMCLETFHYHPRPDASTFEDGHVFELGGDVRVEVIHTPGHTRGHCAFRVVPDDVLFLADIDLSGFGPYYADDWSDLEDFERSIERCLALRARYYLTGHHIGLIEDSETYVDRVTRYLERIAQREERLLSFLSEPRNIEQIVEHRFIYRPQDRGAGIDRAERTSMTQHLERLEAAGRVGRDSDDYYRARGGS